MSQTKKSFALVTGASKGIGKAIACELASRHIHLLLVSLKGEGLPEFCTEIQNRYGVDARYFETDLSRYSSVYKVAEWAVSNYSVFMLVNNAGIGGTQSFDRVTPEYIDNIIQVNVRATSLLTRLLLPELRKQEKGYILNVASMASFSPFAFKTVYPASKAFVASFTWGLKEELKGSSIYVSAIHPGPVKTNREVTSRIEKLGILGRMGLVSPEKIAETAIRQMFRGHCRILPGMLNKINWALMMLIPNAVKLPLLSRVVRKEFSTHQPAEQIFMYVKKMNI